MYYFRSNGSSEITFKILPPVIVTIAKKFIYCAEYRHGLFFKPLSKLKVSCMHTMMTIKTITNNIQMLYFFEMRPIISKAYLL